MAETPHYHGHRQRLRLRFASAGADSLSDYELLELLLFSAQPRGDVKPLAKRLLKHFGSLGAVLGAEPKLIAEIEGAGDAAVHAVKLAQAISLRTLRDDVMERHVLGSWDAVLRYCDASMAHLKTEQFRILFLDTRNKLIADEVQQSGTVNHVPLYPREVIKRALDVGASAIILVHNHPSGDPKPSRADIEMTREVVDAGGPLGVAVHDHLVIGKNGHVSFKTMGLL